MSCLNCVMRDAHARGLCRACYDAELKKENPAYADRQREYAKNWHERNKDHVKQYHKERNAKRAQDPEYKEAKRISTFLRTYKLTFEELTELLSRSCEICGSDKNLRIDHDHDTGKVRGRLCHPCNLHLGWFEKADWREKAARYLEKHQEHNNDIKNWEVKENKTHEVVGHDRKN